MTEKIESEEMKKRSNGKDKEGERVINDLGKKDEASCNERERERERERDRAIKYGKYLGMTIRCSNEEIID